MPSERNVHCLSRQVSLVVLCLTLVPVSWAQTPLDSLRRQAEQTVGLERAAALLSLTKEVAKTDNAEGLILARETVALATELGDSSLVARGLRELGVLQYFSGNFEEAHAAYVRGHAAAQHAGDASTRAYILNEMGTLYKRQGDLDRSMEYFQDALGVSEAVGDTLQIASSLNNIGIVHDVRGEYAQAMELFGRSARMKESIGDLFGLTFNLDNMGMVSARLGHYAEAEAYFDRAATLRLELGDRRGYGIILNNLGEMMSLRGRWSDARTHYQQALAIARETRFADFERHILGVISETFEKEGDWAAALSYYKQQSALADSLFNEERSRQLIAMREEFETARREQTIELQEARLSRQATALQRNYLLLGLAATLLAAMGLVVVWQRSRQELRMRQVQNTASIHSQENERKRIAQDLHDGLGQMIATAKLASETAPNSADRDGSLLEEMYSEIKSVAFNLRPAALSRGGAVHACQELAERISLETKLQVSVSATDVDGNLSEDSELALYRIVQEWLSNVIKHGNATRVDLQFVGHSDELVLTIEDDGQGFDPHLLEQSRGNGWLNIQARAGIVGGVIHVDSNPARKGTTFIVRLPIHERVLA